MMRSILLLFAFLFSVDIAYSETFLFKDGRSDYFIVVSEEASQSERTAASEFQSYVEQIGGVKLPIVRQPKPGGKSVYIGYHPVLGKLVNVLRPADDDEAFTYRTIGGDLFIYGGKSRGTMYGVYSFLEQQMGVRWYTSTFTKIPKMGKFVLSELNHRESPAISYRLDFFYHALRDEAWRAHNLLNTNHMPSNGKYGKYSACWGIHTFEKLIPPSDYFARHPEYFAVYKGKRSDKTQLCLSNKEVCNELISNLKKVISRNPDYWCYEVSQNDNRFPCECAACTELSKRYGGHSGALLWFVNKVAAEIKKTYPDVYISTLAYQYTRQAPSSSIKPADNVVIRLCDIECCQAHPLDVCEKNKAFVRDMNSWKRITNKIYVWDYATGFRHYLLPFPNFDVLARNYQYFCQSNVIGILEEGAHNAPWSEFSELKQWLVAKLLWNPRQSTDSLATLFINDYYGPAAPSVQRYYDLCRRQVTPGKHFDVSIEWNTELYNKQFITEAEKLLKKAHAVSRDKETLRRINRLAAQIHYLQLRRNTPRSLTNGTARKLLDIIHSDSTIVREMNGDINRLMYDLGYH